MILNPGGLAASKPVKWSIMQVGTGSQIFMDLGVQKMRLMSAPFKFTGISGFDLEVVEHTLTANSGNRNKHE